ncbi:hypothetical protein GCM10010488_20640 [Oerskovia jenensis]
MLLVAHGEWKGDVGTSADLLGNVDPALDARRRGWHVGLVLLATVAFGAYLLVARRNLGKFSPRRPLACALTGLGIPVALLVLVLIVCAGLSPLTAVLVPVR